MMDEQKKEYREPELRVYGELRQLTLGMNGSCLDGNGSFTQQGGASTCGTSGSQM